MSPLAKSLDEIKFQIPLQVLHEAFKEDRPRWRKAPVSLDDLILHKIIRQRVLVDCNLVGGQTVLIPLDGIAPDMIDNYSSVYHIPKDRTQNKTIQSVLSVGYTPYSSAFNSSGMGFGNVSPGSMTDLTSAAQRVSDSMSGIPPVSNANVTLIAENTILLRDQFRVTSAYVVRCILANDDQLSNISLRSILNFSQLCVLAVKAYIYNTMLVRVDQAFLEGGQELGSMKNYVESLSDSEVNYRTFLNEVWQKTAFMNDTHLHDRFLKLMVNPGI